jgi:hypothetical protein
MNVVVSLFERAADNSPEAAELPADEFLSSFLEEPELVEGVTSENAKAMKHAGRAWGGSFAGTRSKANFVSIPAIVFDIDGDSKQGVSLPELLDILDALFISYAVHSTFSSGFVAPRHKLRVVLPTSRPVNADEYVQLWDRFARVGGAYPPTGTAQRLHFAPRIPVEHRDHYFAKVVSDRPLLQVPSARRSLNDIDSSRGPARDWLQELRTCQNKNDTLYRGAFKLAKDAAQRGEGTDGIWAQCRAALEVNTVSEPVADWNAAELTCARAVRGGIEAAKAEEVDPLESVEAAPSADKKKIRKAEKELEAARKQLKRAGNHENLARQAKILGEYVSSGAIDENTVRAVLLSEADPGGESVFETALAAGKAVKLDVRAWVKGLPLTEEGALRVSDNSVIRVLREHPECKDVLYYDLRGGCVSARREPPWRGEVGRADVDKCAAAVMEWLCETFQGDVSLSRTKECFVASALEDEIDPFKDYLEGLEWDGVERLTTWLQMYVKCEDSPYVRLVGRKWLISAVARAFEPGVKVDTMLVFTGKQGKGKSTVFENLMPDKNWYSDHLPDIDDKDVHLELSRLVISEMGELSQVQKKTMERVKQFITMKAPSVRGSYEHASRPRPRRGVFCATTNTPSDFLEDEEARRFWLVAVTGEKCDYNGITAVRDQLWAEAVAAYRACEPWHMDEEGEKLSKAVEEIMVRRDALAEKLEDYAENGIPEKYLTSAAEDGGGKHLDALEGQLSGNRVPLFLTIENVCTLFELDIRKNQKYAGQLLMSAGFRKGPRERIAGRKTTPYWNARTLKR